MNLFCFTLDGSSESIYEPPLNSGLKEVLPKYHCSPLLRRRPPWTGSDPNISNVQPPDNVRLKRHNRRSCIPSSALENETSDYTCWTSSGLWKNHQETELKMETSKAACHSNTEDRMMEINCGKMKNSLLVQSGKSRDEIDEPMTSTARRLKMLHDLMKAKNGRWSSSGKGKHQPNNSNVPSKSNPVLTCISLGKRVEKKSCQTDQQLQQEEVNNSEDLKSEDVSSSIDSSQPCSPYYYTCSQPGHELWVCGGNLLLPRATEWDRFESLIQELDRKEADLPSTTIPESSTDTQSTENSSKFGKLGTPTVLTPFMKPLYNTNSLLEQSGTKQRRGETEEPPRADTRSSEKTEEEKVTAFTHVNNQKQGTKRESGDMRIITERCKLSSTSMESLYSRQSSSSGVTSDCSSNRGSLRLEDEFFCTRQFCGRARVHTEFTPSPYDTESLTLKVGDVINIIHKRPMGIWTGMLNDQVGNFKFIYVDELTGGPEAYKEAQSHGAKQKCKSTVHEVLKHLSLEEYSCSLEQNGYQTVDDLMRLKEHHLTKLKVTDPVHRRRLLAAVESFQQLSSNCHMEEPNQEAKTPGENTKADLNNCARDSGCHMPSDITNGREEDTDLPFPCGTPEPAKTMIS
ncbi:SAM domain-containing protein SAMSN-1b isoform X2 [Corythoichthys intestinalis]|uniref:SAM domain-containing protein SAMSN-1b isoform X2 n=1 Tax=Corythoichthys intestinalis TaxID=161448 RepID=UPI0025A677B5|nr:SAM domain-containing protein SAMSN-1b isoform X2 [Corythoichthys intestinalis]